MYIYIHTKKYIICTHTHTNADNVNAVIEKKIQKQIHIYIHTNTNTDNVTSVIAKKKYKIYIYTYIYTHTHTNTDNVTAVVAGQFPVAQKHPLKNTKNEK